MPPQIPKELFKTRELTPDEAKALTDDLKAVLEKHNAELGVVSSIQLLRYVDDIVNPKTDGEVEDSMV